MEPNPYESPRSSKALLEHSHERLTTLIVGFLIFAIGLGACLQLMATLLQGVIEPLKPLAGFMASRFGWIGLVIGLNAIGPLASWLKKKQTGALLTATIMLLVTAAADLWMIVVMGNLQPVESNPYLHRVQPAWAYVVAPFTLAACVVAWRWWLCPRDEDSPGNQSTK